MDESIIDLLNGDEDDILAKVQEESLRFYNEIELPLRQIKEGIQSEKHAKQETLFTAVKPSCSRSEEKETVLYEGEEAQGFHLAAGSTYIYPTNYPIRQYQANITRKAIFKNTLVTLPTGLGKTFIAAVVMYNYYRWYPKGKVIFMAPTRPLVAQQIKACHHIMNIPINDTTEMTGMNNSEQRRNLWKQKRVFFLTPQVMVNDLKSGFCSAKLVKCIVFDEAHRAVKEYAYCQVVKLMAAAGGQYRTLALSATPGSDINSVKEVIRNLNIVELQIRGEDSLDVSPYTFTKTVENVVVELSINILRVKEDFLQVYDKYARRLKDYRALTSNISFLSKFQVLKACEKFRSNPPRGLSPALLGSLICDFQVCMSLAHSLELLHSYGLRAFHSYLKNEGGEKCKAATTRLNNDEDLQKMLTHLGEILYPKSDSHKPYVWGHPKLQKLVATIKEHFNTFNQTNQTTKAIVFCQYRVVVNEIVEIFKKIPNIKPAIFVGQSGGKGKGMPQAKQIQIMKDFRDGHINCLVATCVAEEGLDIGEVDLILLMDTQKSPVRLVQRLGRTGRKRKGRCVVFLTQGKELEKFNAAMAARKAYVSNIVNSNAIKSSLQQYSPPMIPLNINPKEQLVHINTVELISPAKPVKNKQIDIRNCFAPKQSPFITGEQFMELKNINGLVDLNFKRLPERIEMWYRMLDQEMPTEELLNKNVSILSSCNDWNAEKQSSYLVDHTEETNILCHLLTLARNTNKLDNIYRDNQVESNKIINSVTLVKKQDGNDIKSFDEFKEKNILKERKVKKFKKENNGKTLDIRECMAAAAGKTKQLKVMEVDIDIIDQIDSPPPQTSKIETLDFVQDILWLFNLEKNIDMNALKFDVNEFENDIESSSKLKNYLIPKNIHVKCFSIVPEIDVPKVDDILKNVDGLLKTTVAPLQDLFVTIAEQKLLELSESEVAGSNEIVSIDDLFKTSDDDDDELVASEFKQDDRSSEIIKYQEKGVNGLRSPNLNNDQIIKTPCKGTFQDTSECFKNRAYNSEVSRIVSSTPFHNKTVAKFHKNKSSDKLSTDMCSSKAMVDDGVWNLSDLFESESEDSIEQATTSNAVTTNSTMIGITQMVSQIERMKEGLKRDNREVEDVNQTIQSTEVKPIQNKIGGFSDEIDSNLTSFNKNNSKELQSNFFSEDMTPIIEVSSCPVLSNTSKHLKPNFQNFLKNVKGSNEIFSQLKRETSSSESFLSEFTFTSHKTQISSSKPNFKIFRRKQNVLKNSLSEELNSSQTIVSVGNGDQHMKEDMSSTKTDNDASLPITYSNNSNINIKTKLSIEKAKVRDIKFNRNEESEDGSEENLLSSKKSLDESEDEDDDVFETSKIIYKRKTEENNSILSFSPSPIKKKAKKRKNCHANGFIEKEADVSGDVISLDDSDNSSLDCLDESFINDESHNIGNNTQVEYLRSVKSPRCGRNFKIPIVNNCNKFIYSQRVEQDGDYINDSFCVSSSGEEVGESETSELELAERLLELKKRKKINKKFDNCKLRKKRLRIISPEKEENVNLITDEKSSIVIVEEDDFDENIGIVRSKSNQRCIILSDSDADSPIKRVG